MSTKAKIQKIRAEVEAHEDRGWLKGYEEGLAKREAQIVEAQAALEARNERIRELSHQKNGPTTSREALDLAWELAHEVKEGQTVPEGTRYLEFPNSELREYTAPISLDIFPALVPKVRTHEPLPDPDPDWFNAPAVLANDHRDRLVIFFPVADRDKYWQSAQTGIHYHWSYLTDVTPLYPKETNK